MRQFLARLSLATLNDVKPEVARPAYDPADVAMGVVHFGPGAFHRAHQAAVFDTLCEADPRWGICGVSLHSQGVRDALQPQDGLYTLAILDEVISYRIIGAVREVLVAPEDPAAVFARLDRAEIVTTTVTEKGYCLSVDGALDFAHPDIVHDLAQSAAPKSLIGYLVEGLRRRQTAGKAPFVLIPCDNLPKNGHRLKGAVVAFAGRLDADLAAWIEAGLACPCTMVDSITPATDDTLRALVADATGLEDAWPIRREAFTQWVIERHAHAGGPDWEAAGVTLTDNVPAYERAKLRLLNASHSWLAYAGSLKGYETVADAMADAELAGRVRDLMIKDMTPLLETPAGMDLPGYCDAILKRFRNPAIRHLLSQIAWDGSQKLPIRILSSLSEAVAKGHDLSRLGAVMAAWMRFVRMKAQKGETITDPLGDELAAIGRAMTDGEGDVDLFLALRAVFPQDLVADERIVAALKAAYRGFLS